MVCESKAHILTKDFLLKHYVELGKSSPEIAAEFPVSETLVKKYLVRFDIPRRPCTDKAHEVLRTKGHYKRDNSYIGKMNKTLEHREKNSESKRGKKNSMYGRRGKLSPRYIHGKASEAKLEWGRSEWKEWRRKVFERDNFVCRICGKKGGTLNAHHIKKRSLFPELKYNVDNGITLCKSYHQSICGKEEKYELKFQEIIRHTFLPRVDLDPNA